MDQSAPKKARKERAQLSCAFCRHRKLKCDRNQPCENCVKRNQSCHYATPAVNRVGKPQDHGNTAIQNRIQHLEGLVLSLMGNDKSGITSHGSDTSPVASSESGSGPFRGKTRSLSPSSDDTDQALKSFGMMNVGENQTKYVGNEHWAAILQDINEVKNHFESQVSAEEDAAIVEPANAGPELLMGFAGSYTKMELLSKLPVRSTCDSLISGYLNSADPLTVLFHLRTFQNEYERFWRDPTVAPTTWVSMLYSILSIITFWQTRAMDLSAQAIAELTAQVSMYRRQACKCLIHSGYLVPRKYTVEAILMYLGTEYVRSHEIEPHLWVVFGMTVRLAISMGYHREPSHFPDISPFQGEMRRRAWAIIAQLDILTSVQVGLPRMVRDSTADTRLAGNYQDDDLHEDMKELPPQRPNAEYTKLSYQIMKGRLTRVLGMILDEVDDIQDSSYEEIVRLDGRLREAYNSMPDVLRMRPMKAAVGDKPSLIMRRINLELVYLKALCILHRKYLTAALSNPTNATEYAFSRDAGISAAVSILEHQAAIDSEIRIGGRLANDKWLISALTTNDFTVAAMLVCLELDYRTSGKAMDSDNDKNEELYRLLEKSSVIWRNWYKQAIATPKAKMASDALSIILAKCRKTKAAQEISAKVSPPPPPPPPPPPHTAGDSLNYEQYVYTRESQQSQLQPSPESNHSDMQSVPSSMENAIQTWIDAPQDIQWPQWDEFFQPSHGVLQSFEPENWRAEADFNKQDVWPIDTDFTNGINIAQIPQVNNGYPGALV